MVSHTYASKQQKRQISAKVLPFFVNHKALEVIPCVEFLCPIEGKLNKS